MGLQPMPFILIAMTKNNDTSNFIFTFLKAKEQKTDHITMIVNNIIGNYIQKNKEDIKQ